MEMAIHHAAEEMRPHAPKAERTGRKVTIGWHYSPPSARTAQRSSTVARRFGVAPEIAGEVAGEKISLAIEPGKIILLTGPSGSGKSTALAEIERRTPGCTNVQRARFCTGLSIVDQIAPEAPLSDGLSILTRCGLGEARLWLRPYDALSEGERFRARLAKAMAAHVRNKTTAPLLCDEFCVGLHRRIARAICYNLRGLAERHRLCLIVATCDDELKADLNPDWVVEFLGRGRCRVRDRNVRGGASFGLRRRLRIERGRKRDYADFSAMHYRATDELGFVDRVFVLREGKGGPVLGVVVYARAPLELSLRNRATHGWFSRNPARVNEALRILRRLVIHPDVRGCGLGHYLVRKTLPLAGTPFVECLAGMGEFNPVFEKAGMKRIGQYEVPPQNQAAVKELLGMGVDPQARDFVWQVCRKPAVRAIVLRVVWQWYRNITAGCEGRVHRQSPELLVRTFRSLIGSQPVYYLWRARHRKLEIRNKKAMIGASGGRFGLDESNQPNGCDRSAFGAPSTRRTAPRGKRGDELHFQRRSRVDPTRAGCDRASDASAKEGGDASQRDASRCAGPKADPAVRSRGKRLRRNTLRLGRRPSPPRCGTTPQDETGAGEQ